MRTKANPADKLTRGLSAKSLVKDKCWFEGPEFLNFSPDKWSVLPLNLSSSEVSKCFESQKGTTLATTTVQHFGGVAKTCEDCLPMFLLIANFSSPYRLKLAAAWFARFKCHLWTLCLSDFFVFLITLIFFVFLISLCLALSCFSDFFVLTKLASAWQFLLQGSVRFIPEFGIFL